MKESVFLKLASSKEHEHLCHLYSNDTERLEIGANFIIHIIKNKERCLYISDTILPQGFIERLIGNGVNIDKARREKDLEEIIALGRRREEIKDPDSFTRFLNEKIEAALKSGRRLVVSQLEDDGISAVLWFDKLTTNGLAQIPFTLSLSKSVFACLNPIKFRLTDH